MRPPNEQAAADWAAAWPKLESRMGALPLDEAHAILCEAAMEHLPFAPMNPPEPTDQFLSEEDLDLVNLSWEELLVQWDAWLRAASATDDEDAGEYEHGVFQRLREQP